MSMRHFYLMTTLAIVSLLLAYFFALGFNLQQKGSYHEETYQR